MTSDHMKLSDHAKSRPPDQSRAQKGLDHVGQQLSGSDAPQMQDRAPGHASDANKAQQGIDRIDAELRATPEQAGVTKEIIHVPDTKEVYFDELKPNVIYEKNDYKFHTDEYARPNLISGQLKLEKGIRSEQQTIVGKLGIEHDEGGHLIGARFDGPPDGFNLVPQNADLNRRDWRQMEETWAHHLKNKATVEVEIHTVYTDESRRPMRFDVIYSVDNHNGDIIYKTLSFCNKSPQKE